MKVTSLPGLPAPSSSPKAEINQPATNESPQAALPVVSEEQKPTGAEEQFSAKYAELAKREKVLRNKIQAREQALSAREEQIKAKEAEYASQYIPKSKIPEMFQRDPHQALRELGLTGDQITQYLLNQPNPQDLTIQELKAEIAALKTAQDKTKNTFEERDKLARNQAVEQIRRDVKALVANDPNYDTIKETGSEDEVVKYIETKFDEEGILLTNEEAAAAVENQLVEELSKYSRLKKIQALLAPTPVVEGKEPADKLPQKPQVKTLAHSQVSSGTRPMSPRERAIALLEGKQI